MKFTYKERQDILWSLNENAKRLGDMMAGYKNVEPAYERAEDQDGLKRVRDKYAEAEGSCERLRDLARRLETS
jgi:hypothetical protein